MKDKLKARRVNYLLAAIAAKMREMGAKDLGDDELERCLGNCVAQKSLMKVARAYRDSHLYLDGAGRVVFTAVAEGGE